ncbi:branched-chain amino acid ABC transporter permease [Gemmobacter serpentinus]|uniref:branched-chain amino acid ABC transporter permease n=1 Tax=Gemmobacter serpentinus TaxID=2652247 RepID=UPI00124F769D|nr:branched-chain amino acid ABC transporter permease [Gemmobacter serpentinus]
MRPALLHIGVLAALVAAGFLLPAYQHGMLARILVMAVFAMGYNLAFGYTGLLSLGHALHFCAGMMATGLAMRHGLAAGPALILGLAAGTATAMLTGLLALRTAGVSFMIVTLMFAQAFHLTLLYYGGFTGGDEGFPLPSAARRLFGLDLTQAGPRYAVALALFAAGLLAQWALVRSRFGRSMIAMRENEERSRMLGYNPFTTKLAALALSGLYSGAAGAAYGLLFGYVGASFGTSQYSILPLLYVLLGGAGTTLGPLLGAGLMAWLIDAASSLTDSPLAVIGITLIVLVLFAPKGILGTLREKGLKWLP